MSGPEEPIKQQPEGSGTPVALAGLMPGGDYQIQWSDGTWVRVVCFVISEADHTVIPLVIGADGKLWDPS